MTDSIKSKNITWHEAIITREDRERLNGHKAVVIWFTGLSGSGKSTLAQAVEKALFDMGCRTFVLDGDNIRHGLNKDLGFSPEDREENIRRIGEVANLFVDAGVFAMTAFISPYRADRDKARALAPEGRFFEIFLTCPLEVCEERDPKGLYKKARAGEIKEFTGVDSPYEPPTAPEIVLDTERLQPKAAVQAVVEFLEQKEIIGGAERSAGASLAD